MTIETKNIDFKVLGEPLNKLLIAVGDKLSRAWPTRYRNVIGARELFVSYMRATHQTYLSALYLCGDVPSDPRRKPEFCIALAPVNRAVLDSLFNILFILEDLVGRCEWFYEASWREGRLEFERLTAEYGALPEWKDWLAQLDKVVEMGRPFTNIRADQVSNPRALRSWPNAGAMWRHGVAQGAHLPAIRQFMKYLDDYFYVELSQQAHLTQWGMMKRTAFLLDDLRSMPGTDLSMKKYRYFQIAQTTIFALAIATEIDAHFRFELRQQCLYLWTIASQFIVIAEEIYRKRYRDLLGGSS